MRPSEHKTGGRYLPLEALRGFAAIFIALYHFFLGYAPAYLGLTYPIDHAKAWVGSPFYIVLNGKAMLAILFVLSGYILSLKGLRPHSGAVIADASAKRWFRFVPLMMCANLFACALSYLHLYHYDDAVRAGAAPMLRHYASHGLPQTFQPKLATVLYESFIGSLFLGQNSLDSAMWTLQVEFYGSFLVFGLAFFLAPERRWWLKIVLPLTAVMICVETVWFIAFIFGFLGVVLRLDQRRLDKATATLLLVAGLYLCGYYYPEGWYGWASFLPMESLQLRMFILSAGAFLLLCFFVTHNSGSRFFNGTISRYAGRMSFALYLLHMLILSSFCASAYVWMGGGSKGVWMAAATFVVTSVPFVYALSWFDVWWLQLLSRWHPLGGKV